MHLTAHFVPAKKQYGQKAGLQEKCEDTLRRQRAAKDVADIARVAGPIGAKFKFHDEAGGDAEGERERKDVRPELRHLVIDVVFGPEPCRLHDDEHDADADAQRRINVVKPYG